MSLTLGALATFPAYISIQTIFLASVLAILLNAYGRRSERGRKDRRRGRNSYGSQGRRSCGEKDGKNTTLNTVSSNNADADIKKTDDKQLTKKKAEIKI